MPERTRSLSALLQTLPEDGEGRLTVEQIGRHFGRRSLGALMFILALPNIFPMPPGASIVLGAPLLLITPQLAFGRLTPWLPASISGMTINRAAIVAVCERAAPWVVRAETLTKRRMPFFFSHAGDMLMGVVCTLLAAILILPLPLGNVLPGLALAVLAFSLVQRDGALAILGYSLALVAVGVLALAAGAVLAALEAIF
jgi:hypothetical protein